MNMNKFSESVQAMLGMEAFCHTIQYKMELMDGSEIKSEGIIVGLDIKFSRECKSNGLCLEPFDATITLKVDSGGGGDYLFIDYEDILAFL